MTGLRQRRGVLAVDRVDRLEEPKEHVVADMDQEVETGQGKGRATGDGVPAFRSHGHSYSGEGPRLFCALALPVARGTTLER